MGEGAWPSGEVNGVKYGMHFEFDSDGRVMLAAAMGRDVWGKVYFNLGG